MISIRKVLTIAIVWLAATGLPTAAFAYIGPGAGLSLLGALWALIAAVGTAVLFIVAWPLRKYIRRRRERRRAAEQPVPGE